MKRFPTNLRLMLVALCAVCLGVSAWAGLNAFNFEPTASPNEEVASPAQVKRQLPADFQLSTSNYYRVCSVQAEAYFDVSNEALTPGSNTKLVKFDQDHRTQQWSIRKVGEFYQFLNRASGLALNAPGGEDIRLNLAEPNDESDSQLWSIQPVTESGDEYYYIINKGNNLLANRSGSNTSYLICWKNNADNPSKPARQWMIEIDEESTDLNNPGDYASTLSSLITEYQTKLNAETAGTEAGQIRSDAYNDMQALIDEATAATSTNYFNINLANTYTDKLERAWQTMQLFRVTSAMVDASTINFDADGNYHLFWTEGSASYASTPDDFGTINTDQGKFNSPWGFYRYKVSDGSYTPFSQYSYITTNNINNTTERGEAWHSADEYCFVSSTGNYHAKYSNDDAASPAIVFTAPNNGIYYASITVKRAKSEKTNLLVLRSRVLDATSMQCDKENFIFAKGYGTVSIDGVDGTQPQTLDFYIRLNAGQKFTFETENYTAKTDADGRTYITDLAVATVGANGQPFTLAEAQASPRFYDAVGEEESAEKVDVLNQTVTGISGTSYTNFSEKTVTSDAVYAGQCAGGNNSIQLRSSGNNSGVITTTSGGKAKKIEVDWNANTANGRTLQVYGSSTAYSAATDLYSANTQGTLLGEIVCGTSTELTIEGDYAYIGFKSKNQAMYLTSVSITWATASSQPTEPQSQVKTYNINIEREAGQGSNAQTEYFDFTEAKTFLGVEAIAADRFDIIQPTGVVEFNYAQYNGWFDNTGAPTTLADLGNNPGICLNFPDALNGGSYTISDQNMTDAAVGQTYDLTWEIQDNSKAVHFRFHITYTAPKPTYTTCKAANEAATANEVASRLTLTDALVTFVVPEVGNNNPCAYIEDATGGFLIYGSHKFNAGEKFTGTIEGKLVTFKGTPELQNPQYSDLSVTSENNPVTPTEVDAAELAANPLKYVSQYVVVKPATFASTQTVSTKKNVDFTVGNTALAIRNNFTVTFSVDQTKEYSVAGLVTIYDEAKQLYPTKTEDVAEIVPDPDGTDLAAENAAAVAAVTNGKYYYIYTEDATGKKFYMKIDGYLTDDISFAAKVPLKLIRYEEVTVEKERQQFFDQSIIGFQFGASWSNPNTGTAEGAIQPMGHIKLDGEMQNRATYETQVFYLGANSGKYAIRATNTSGVRWGANSYWTTTDTDADGLPEAEYSLTADYRWQLADAPTPAEEHAAAVAAVTEGHGYRIFTQGEAGAKFYLKKDGYLTANEADAAILPMKFVSRTGVNIGNLLDSPTLDVTAFKFDARFSNPNCVNDNAQGAINPKGHIIVNAGNNRDDYESQVFFRDPNSGYYAIRATACYNISSGVLRWKAHSYWTTTDTNTDGLPEAEYRLGADYIWQLEDVTYDIPEDMPDPTKKYTIKNRDADLYMSLDAEQDLVTLSTNPVELSFESDGNGAWYITDGTSYVGLAGNNAWTMAAAADKKTAITLAGYTFSGQICFTMQEANGIIGSDNLEAGKKCYADKTAADHGYWILTAIEPEPEPEGDIIYVDKDHGTYYNGANEPLTDTGWGASWKSTQTDPQLTLTASSGINVENGMHFGPAGVTYTLTVPNGYVITGYSLTPAALPDGSSTLTPEGSEAQPFVIGKPNTVSGLSAQTTTFTITDGRARIDPTNFKVYVKEVEVVEPVVFAKIISDNNLIAGEKYLVVYEDASKALGALDNNIGTTIDITIEDNKTSITNEAVDIITLGGDADGWTFASSLGNGYLSSTTVKKMATVAEATDAAKWTITFDEDGNAAIFNVAQPTWGFQYNSSSPRFTTYASNQKRVQLYKAGEILAPPADVAAPTITPATGIYTSAQRVTMRAEEGATIFYTVNDGEEQEYDKPFSVSETSVIVAYAKVGNVTSPTTTVTITIQNTGDAPMMVFNDEGTQTFTLASDEDITAEDKSGNVIDVTGEDIEDGIVVAYQNVQIENAEAYVAGFRAAATITDSKGNTYTVKTRADENNVMYVAKGLFGPNETYEVTIQPIVYYNYDQFCDAIYELWETGKATHQIPDPKDPKLFDELNNPIPGTGESTILDPTWTLAAAAAEWSQQLKDNGTIPYTGDVVLFQDCDPMPYYVDNTPHVFIIKTDNSVNANVKALLSQEFKVFDAEGNDFTAEFLTINGGIATVISGVNSLNGDARIYNMSGQRVAKTTKGLYIVNGKKVAIK